MIASVLFLIIGFLLLVKGADLFVDGSSSVEVTISVKKDVNVLTGVTSTIIGDSVELTASCTMRKE